MKANRLERKTFFQRQSSKAVEDVCVYDLTGEYSDDVFSLSDYCHIPVSESCEVSKSEAVFFEDEDQILTRLCAIIQQSPVAGALLQDAADNGWSAGFSDLGGRGYFLDTRASVLWLDHFMLSPDALGRSSYFCNAQIVTMIRALRDIWHEHREKPMRESYKPEDVLVAERARAADCDSLTVLACWELRGAGYSQIWRHLLGSEEGDMAMIFSRYLEREPVALFDGTALSLAFRQWYADDERVDATDHTSLEMMDDLLVSADEKNPFGQKKLTSVRLEAMSKIPNGPIYLKGMGKTILADPFYAGLNDPINQTHFFHLMYDLEVVMKNNVPFRSRNLAQKIFPEVGIHKSWENETRP